MTITDVESLLAFLRDYREKKTELAIFGGRDENVEFLEKCLEHMEGSDRDILEKTCMQNVSLRAYARLTGLSRPTLTKARDRALEKLLRYFAIRKEKAL